MSSKYISAIYEWLSLPLDQLETYLQVSSHRSSGPGGQKANKTSSAVSLLFAPLDIRVECQIYRKKEENKRSAMRILREKIALCCRELPDQETMEILKPWFLNGLHVQKHHEKLALIFSVVVSYFHHFYGDHKETAAVLGVSPSRLCRFIFEHKSLLAEVNRIRKENNKSSLMK
ncbi:MAG: peptide chain release factor-like protein [Candidatus Aureabacteria bacterium]|nr:peptide chain release factor-like protein [Candidatus Auribacterota bacterium]